MIMTVRDLTLTERDDVSVIGLATRALGTTAGG